MSGFEHKKNTKNIIAQQTLADVRKNDKAQVIFQEDEDILLVQKQEESTNKPHRFLRKSDFDSNLRLAHESKVIGMNILEKVHDQNQQLDHIEDTLESQDYLLSLTMTMRSGYG